MRWMISLLLLTAALAGCSDSEPDDADGTADEPLPDDPSDEPQDPGPGSGSPPPARDPVTWEVEVQDNRFEPADLTLQAGDAVRFVYTGSNPHTATADDGRFDSGDCPGTDCFAPGVGRMEFTWTSGTNDIGQVAYFCEVHGSMTGTLTIEERYDATPA